MTREEQIELLNTVKDKTLSFWCEIETQNYWAVRMYNLAYFLYEDKFLIHNLYTKSWWFQIIWHPFHYWYALDWVDYNIAWWIKWKRLNKYNEEKELMLERLYELWDDKTKDIESEENKS